MAMEVNDAAAGAAGNRMHVGDGKRQAPDNGRAFLEVLRRLPDARYHTSANGLKVATVKEGHGPPLAAGMKIKVQYTGWLEDGTKFDTSLARGEPFEFTLGAGRVIKGWEEGLTGIRAGERRQIIIPAELGYGNRQMGKIPPGSTLIFNVEAVAVDAPPANPKGTMTVVA